MINQHVAYYLGSKIIAAVLNLGSMAAYVRLGGAETYGGYVVALASAYIVYSFTLQWLRFSFFACYRDDNGPALIATYLRLQAMGLVAIAGLACAAVWSGLVGSEAAIGIVALTTGLAIYDSLHEMGRTRLQARAVAAGALARAGLMLVLGALSLRIWGTATALALAVALAHLLAALPLFVNLRGHLGAGWSSSAFATLLGYGRGLIPAFGVDGIGLQVDRLLLARSGTLGDVGAYGAVADLVRQIMVVISEAIAGAYIAIARSELVAGREPEAVKVLGQAFLAFTALASFGAAAIARFDRLVLDTMFGAAIGESVEPVLGLILASSVLLVFRSYYFGQVLYLTPDVSLLMRSNAVHCGIMVVLGLVLTPVYGMTGAALALTLAHAGGILVYLIAWRGTFALRLPFAGMLGIIGLATAAFVLTGLVEGRLADSSIAWRWTGVTLNTVILSAAGVMAARLYNLLSFNDLVVEVRRVIRLRLQRSSS